MTSSALIVLLLANLTEIFVLFIGFLIVFFVAYKLLAASYKKTVKNDLDRLKKVLSDTKKIK